MSNGFKNSVRFLVSFFLVAYLLILLLLNFNPLQSWFTEKVASALSYKIKSEVTIGDIQIGLFNRVVLRDVLIEDQAGKNLLKADLLSAKIEFLPLLSGQVSLRSVSLLDAQVCLYKENEKKTANFEYIIEAFKSKDTEEKSSINLRINSIILRRCQVGFDILDKPHTPGVFNKNHLRFSDIDANISLKQITNDSLNLRVRSLAFYEQSGFKVNSFTLRLDANEKYLNLKNFHLLLPKSNLKQELLTFTYDLDSIRATLSVNGALRNMAICPSDFACFDRRLSTMDHFFNLSAKLDITPLRVRFADVRLKENRGQASLKADISMNKLNNKEKVLNVKLNELLLKDNFIDNLLLTFEQNEKLKPLSNLGNIALTGIAQYVSSKNFTADLDLNTSAGNVLGGVLRCGDTIKGNVKADSISIAQILNNESLPTDFTFDFNFSADVDSLSRSGNAELLAHQISFKDYTYRNLSVSSIYNKNNLTSKLVSLDPNATIELNGSAYYDGKLIRDIKLDIGVDNFHPKSLHLTDYFSDAELEGKISAFLRSTDLKSPNGWLIVDDFMLADVDTFRVNHLQVEAEPTELGTQLGLSADFGKMDFEGPFSLSLLRDALEQAIAMHLPQVIDETPKNKSSRWKIKANFLNTDFLEHLAKVPLNFPSGVSLEGGLHSADNNLLFSFAADSVVWENSTVLRFPSLIVKNKETGLSALFKGEKTIGKMPLNFSLETLASDGNIDNHFVWSDYGKKSYYGELDVHSSWDDEQNFFASLQPTDFAVNDTIWKVSSGKILYKDSSLQLDSLCVGRENQELLVDGSVSSSPQDTLVAHLKNVDVNYVLGLLNIQPVSFKGLASGKAYIYKASQDSVVIDGKLRLPQFYFNDALLGDAKVNIHWNNSNGRITFDGTKIDEENVGYTYVDGYVSPKEKGLDLRVNSKSTNLFFLNRYLSGIFENLEGRTTGITRIFGPFKKIDFEGKQNPNLSITIPAINVRYDLSEGEVNLTSGHLSFQNIAVKDREGNTGTLHGDLLHDHLKNLRYDFHLTDAEALLLYDKKRSLDMPFYATAYASGNLNLNGYPGVLQVEANVEPADKTLFVYTVDDPSTASMDNQLLRFKSNDENLTELSDKTEHKPEEKTSSGTHLKFRFNVDMRPEATLRVITNAKSGEYLDLHSTGSIQADYDSKGEFTLRHPLTITGGTYQMNIQNFINKKLTFKPGGQINFNGNPFKAALNLQAVYTLNSVSLADLNMGNRLSSASTPVNCVFLFTGTAGAPQVDFNFELPNASDEVEQMVSDLIATEEDKRMQALYLLGIGRFYTYDYASTTAAESQSQTSVAMKSFLSTTLSSQLNNILQNAISSSNWTFGANLATGNVGWSDMEVEGILTGRLLSGRLLINGNFGYRDKNATYTNSNFVGDLDLEYLITPSGNVRLLGYSKTNDKYFSTSSLTTQGVGIRLTRTFDNIKELFKSHPILRTQKEDRND